MENTQDNSIFGLDVDDEGKSHLTAIAQWANINAITGFVALGVSLISIVLAFTQASDYISSRTASPGLLSFVIELVFSLILNITLLNAASNIKKGVEQGNQGLFGIGLTKLATYFKIVGILTIVVLVIMGLAILVGIVFGAAGFMR